MNYAPLQEIVNLGINEFNLSPCFHISLAGRFSVKDTSLAPPLMLLNSGTGVGGMDLQCLLVLQEPLVRVPLRGTPELHSHRMALSLSRSQRSFTMVHSFSACTAVCIQHRV